MDVRGFIKNTTPFDLLPDEAIDKIMDAGKQEHAKKESLIYHQNYTKLKWIDILLEGGYQTYFVGDDFNKEMVEEMGPGEVYGPTSLLYNNRTSIRSVLIKADTKLLRVPQNTFLELINSYPDFNAFFIQQFGTKMQIPGYSKMLNREEAPLNAAVYDHFFTKSISSLHPRSLITCYEDQSVVEAAQIMSKTRQSCIFVKTRDEKYIGYMTDITIREKVVAAGMDAHAPVREFMASPIFVISQEALIYEAILMMFKHKIRYVVVEKAGVYTGLLSRNKLLSDQSYSPFVFIQSFKLANNIEELKARWEQAPEIVFQILSRGVKAENVNKVINTITDSITQTIIDKVLEEMGTPPCRFVFMVLGSEGRKEQTLKTDQDNALIYEDRPAEEREGIREYFLAFAEKVSDHLNEVGFVYCEGGFMAKNPKWNHSLSHWKQNYTNWIAEIIPETAANFATFFDSRRVYGDRELIEELKDHIKEHLTHASGRLFYHLAVNALKYEPPLTFFRSIRTISKNNQEVFNIKHAMTPIVDIIRVYALKHQIMSTNTGERLLELYKSDLMTKEQYYELLQAYYFLMAMRLKRQAKTIIRKQGEPTNFIEPKSLTNIERVTLREIFKVIARFQTRVKTEFTGTTAIY